MNKPIKKEKEFLREVFDAMPEGIIVLDTSFRILSMNDAAENIFKVSREKASGKPCFIFLPKEIEEIAEKSIKEERSIFGDSVKAVLRGGERVSIQATASPLLADKGEVSGIIIQIKDLSGAEFLSERNSQQISTSALEGLILGLAHELKNPLSGIRGAAQLLLEGTNRETIKCAKVIVKEADRLTSLLDTLKRLEPFPREEFEPVDVHEILTEIIFLESKSDRQKGIKFVQRFDVTLPPVLGDSNSLKQVFLNLIKNAKEAIHGNGTVEVSTRWITDYKLKDESAISVDIKDNGAGIKNDDLEKIFSPFYTTKRDGSGLGLFLAYQIIAKHDGAIFVESEYGKGTVFKVYMPIYRQ